MSTSILNIMSDVDTAIAKAETPVREVWTLMSEKNVEHIPVLRGDELVGMVSAWDLARAGMEQSDQVGKLTAGDVMEKALERLHPKDTAERATRLLKDGRYHSLPVVDDEERLVGIVTSSDLLRLSSQD